MRTLDSGDRIKVLRVVVWYADGRRLWATNTVAAWRTLPAEDVVLVQVLYDLAHKGKWLQEVLYGQDYYWLEDGDYRGGSAGLVPQSIDVEDLKRGVWVSDAIYLQMYNEAHQGEPV